MTKEQTQYRSILKATSIFGGVQVISIVTKIISSKFIAIILGPAGIGVISLYNSSISLISSFTNFGIGTSAVKNISSAKSSGDQIEVNLIASVIKKIVWLTGLFGAIFTFCFSSFVSKLTFGNVEYNYAFKLLSIVLLINQLTNGEKVLLQGLRKINSLAKSTIISGLISLVITIPLYYFYELEGIVAGIILSSLTSLLITFYYSRTLKISKINLSLNETLSKGKNMMFMGVMISLGGMMSAGAAYVIRIYINNSAGEVEVGLFNAGFAVVNSYVGLVFTAMATDYYPRLSAVSKNNFLTQETINQQATISILILAPVLLIFLIFIKWFIIILYSTEFLIISSMIYWAALGVFFKAVSWSIGFVFLSKGDSKLYFWNELITTIYTLALNIIGYYFMGLEGLGISFLLSYIIHLFQVYIVTRIKFNFRLENNLIKIFIFQFCIAILGFLCTKHFESFLKYFLGIILIFCSIYYSYIELDKRINISSLIIKKSSKNGE